MLDSLTSYNSTITLTRWQALIRLLEMKQWERVSATRLKRPFSSDDSRKECLEHRRPLTKYRREHPSMVIKNKKKRIGGDVHSFYMLCSSDFDFNGSRDSFSVRYEEQQNQKTVIK